MIKPAEEESSLSSNINIKSQYKIKFPIAFSLSLLALALCFIFLIVYYFYHQKENITIDIKKDLSVITNMKVKQIVDWRTERLLDGEMILDSKVMINNLKLVSMNRKNKLLKDNTIDWFKSICEKLNYTSVRLVDTNGDVILSYPYELVKMEKKSSLNFNGEGIKQPFLSDLHSYEKIEENHLDLIVPIISEQEESTEEFLVMEIDPEEYFYPLIQTWPSDSQSGETVVFEKVGNEVVYLNELRHIKNSAHKFKINLQNDEVTSVKATKGYTGITDGIDYRNIPVIAYIKPVPGTNWYMIAKMDKEEIYENINKSSLWVAILVILVIIISVVLIILYWSKQREKYLKNIINSDRKRMALTGHFNYIIKNANDVFILYDENTRVVEINEKALSLYGYTKEEFSNLSLNDLRAPSTRNDISEKMKYVQNHPDGLVFETNHIKKDGTEFPVESSSRYIQIGDRFLIQSVVRDISDRKQAEQALLESEQKFSTAFRLSPEAILLVSVRTNKIIDTNDTFTNKTGYNRDEVIGRTALELDLYANFERVAQIINKAIKYGSINGEECDIKTKSGEIIDCLMSTVSVKIGGESYLIISIVDITERKKAEEKIEFFNRLYAFLSQVNQAIVRIENKKELFDIICNIAIVFGKFRFAWIGLIDEKNSKVIPVAYDGIENGYLNIVKESLGNNIKTNEYLLKLLKGKKDIISNDIRNDDFYENDCKEAMENGYESSGIFPLRENNEIIGILCLYSDKVNCFNKEEVKLIDEVTMDISFALDYYVKEAQRKETNEALFKSELKFRSLFDNASDAIILLDDYKFIEFNKVAEQVFELDRNNLLFKSPIELSPEFQPCGISSKEKGMNYMDSAYNGEKIKFEWVHKKSNGTTFETEISLNNVFIGSKKMLLAVVRDISERKKYEQGLKAAVEKAEEVNRIKSNFLANMSHELRTPMTGILGFAEILSKTIEDPEQKEMAEVIFKGGKRLTSTLNMILDLSKIEAEKTDVNLKPTNLSEVITESVKLFEVIAAEKNLEMISEMKEDLFALIDKRLLEQVLSNLIKNALTYTDRGSVIISLSKVVKNGIDFAEIKVTDTGIGIPEDSLDLIFEPFRQVSEGWTRTFEGTGLGLTISKKFVELMNGTIKVESKFNMGTTFIIRFKILNIIDIKPKTKEPDLIEKPMPVKKTNKKILLVEDDEFTVYTIIHVLKDIGNIDVTNNGYDAVKMAKENKYEIILMDIGLKGMDGLSTTKEIRKLQSYEKIPIVAITAYAMQGDKERFINGGCTHYISKPFSNNVLRKFVSEL
jgi:PAS domain S-box-containing protein